MREERVGIIPKIITIGVLLFLMAPLIVIILASFSPTVLVVFPPQGFSLEWYANIFTSSANFVSGFANSIKIAVIATSIDILLGVSAALAVTRYNFKGKDSLVAFFTSPMYVPSIAFSFVILRITSSQLILSAFTRILLGHIVIILPYIVRNTLAVLTGFNWSLEDAAASLGASPRQTFMKVTLPLIKPGVMAGALLSFLYSFDEAVLGNMLNSPKFITLPVRIMNYMEFSFDPTLAAISTLLIILSLTCIVAMERFIGLDMFLK